MSSKKTARKRKAKTATRRRNNPLLRVCSVCGAAKGEPCGPSAFRARKPHLARSAGRVAQSQSADASYD